MALAEKFNEREDLLEGKRNKRGTFICQRKWCWDESIELQKHSTLGRRKERCNVSPVGSQGQMGWPGNKTEDEPKPGQIPAPPSWWGSEVGPEPASFSRLVDSRVQRSLLSSCGCKPSMGGIGDRMGDR